MTQFKCCVNKTSVCNTKTGHANKGFNLNKRSGTCKKNQSAGAEVFKNIQ